MTGLPEVLPVHCWRNWLNLVSLYQDLPECQPNTPYMAFINHDLALKENDGPGKWWIISQGGNIIEMENCERKCWKKTDYRELYYAIDFSHFADSAINLRKTCCKLHERIFTTFSFKMVEFSSRVLHVHSTSLFYRSNSTCSCTWKLCLTFLYRPTMLL